MLENLISVILAGGQGKRLWPLTAKRAKPAVPIAGKFRLIDIAISNCLNSDIRKIYILTQFASESLHRHIHQTYVIPFFTKGFITVLAAQQTAENKDWYQGTADAVRQNLNYLRQKGIEYYLILSGDHLYRMDYREMLATHLENRADVTVSVYPVKRSRAHEFGILKTDERGKIQGFHEKPSGDEILDQLAPHPKWLQRVGLNVGRDHVLASMGIYIFSRDVLIEMLEGNQSSDFGKEIFPEAITRYRVVAHPFTGYWEDIGTIRAFYEAMIGLTKPDPPFKFYEESWPYYTHPRFLPGSRIHACVINESVVCEAARLNHARIEQSIIGIRSFVKKGAELRRVVLMGADFIENREEREKNRQAGIPDVGVGADSLIENAIIDKNVRIGRGVQLPAAGRPADAEGDGWIVRDGILVVPKGVILPDGFRIEGM